MEISREISAEIMREMRDIAESYVCARCEIKAKLAGWCYRGAINGLYQEFCLQLHAIPGASDLVSAIDPHQAGAQLYDLFCEQVHREMRAMVQAAVAEKEGGI